MNVTKRPECVDGRAPNEGQPAVLQLDNGVRGLQASPRDGREGLIGNGRHIDLAAVIDEDPVSTSEICVNKNR